VSRHDFSWAVKSQQRSGPHSPLENHHLRNGVPQGRQNFRPVQIRFEKCLGSATTLSSSNHSFLQQPLFPPATTLSSSNHSFLQQPLFPPATTLSSSNHSFLQQPLFPPATTLSSSKPLFPPATTLSLQRPSPFCHPERTRISCFTALTGDHGCGSLQREPHAAD